MKRYILIALLPALAASLLLAALSPARPAVPDYRAVAAKYPQSDAVVLYDSLVVSMDAAGRIAKRRHRAVMLFTDNAINRYGDPLILFDADREELRVLVARVYMRDGSAVDVKPNSLNQTTPAVLDLAPEYASWQEMVVTHVGIEKGCVAELEYVIAGTEPSPRLSGVEIFSSEDPVELRALVVRPPEGATLKACGMNGAPEARSSGGSWTWTVRDVPGRTPFDGGVWEGDYFPAVCYSTARSWDDALAKLAGDLDAASVPVPAAAEAIREGLKDLSTDEERILAVQRLAIESVRDINAPFSLLAAAPRSAARIYDTGYASTLDRAVLLLAMLRGAGYEPIPVFVSAGRAVSNDVPAPELFGSIMIAAAAKDAGELMLDPAAPLERAASSVLAGKTLARLGSKTAGGTAKEPHLAPPPRNADTSRSTLEIEIAPGETGALSGRGRAVLTGFFSPYYIIRSGTSLEEFVGVRVKRLFGEAELTSCNPLSLERTKAEIEFAFTVKVPEKKRGERAYLVFPQAFDAEIAGIERVHLERSVVQDAIRLEPCALSVTCAIEPPAGWKVVALPPPASVRNGVGAASVAAENAAGSKRIVRSELALDRDVVLPALYPSLRALLAAAADAHIVLEKE